MKFTEWWESIDGDRNYSGGSENAPFNAASYSWEASRRNIRQDILKILERGKMTIYGEEMDSHIIDEEVIEKIKEL